MEELQRPQEAYEIEATSSLADQRTRVLKHGDTFAIFDRLGDLKGFRHGLFHEGTRHLSWLELKLGGQRPLLLSSTVKKDNLLLLVDLTNSANSLEQDTVHVFRCRFLWHGVCYERIKVVNYNSARARISFSLRYDADFADIFEIRGTRRPRRGTRLPTEVGESHVTLVYRGLDKLVRRTHIEFSPRPSQLTTSEARFDVDLAEKDEAYFYVIISFQTGFISTRSFPFDEAHRHRMEALDEYRVRSCGIWTDNVQFNNWLDRSAADLQMLLTETPYGSYPFAGVPWYSTIFGRDGILTAMEYLWVDPELARGVLGCLASLQAKEIDPANDAEPGKIVHEIRSGEMAALGEVPFGRYYGSVDSTPLFVMLAGEYYERTGDAVFIQQLWPTIEAALNWIDIYGDADGDGFVEYLQHSARGLSNQGWKDSHDSVFHDDGRLAEGPIALCEVQGYVYAAKMRAAELCAALGRHAHAQRLRDQAAHLREQFDHAFWDEKLGTYVLALDGEKHPLRVRTSNAGHALFSGIAHAERAPALARTLLSRESFSGWGIRTVATSERRYNPMSYHNGSIWPHDNALIGYGLARYGFKKEALMLLEGMFQTSRFMDINRVPELFCGFTRRTDEAPTLYPVACTPQAWAAAAAFYVLQACLGLSITARPQPRISFAHPDIPDFVNEIRLENLRVDAAKVSLSIRRYREDVGVHVLEREGKVDLHISK